MANLIVTNKPSSSIWLDVVRTDGRGFIFALKKKEPISFTFDNHDEALIEINNLLEDGCDVFVGIGNVLPDASRRIAKNVTDLSSIFIDLDCGPDKPYLTQRDALDSLVSVVDRKSVV